MIYGLCVYRRVLSVVYRFNCGFNQHEQTRKSRFEAQADRGYHREHEEEKIGDEFYGILF